MRSARSPQSINHFQSLHFHTETNSERTLLTSGYLSRCCPFKKYYVFAPQLQYLRKVINSPPYIPCVLVGKLRLLQQWKQGQLSGQFPARWTSAALVAPKEGKKKLSFCLVFFMRDRGAFKKHQAQNSLPQDIPGLYCNL